MSKNVRTIIVLGGVVSLLFQIICLATPNWLEVFSANSGLWQTCLQSICVEIPNESLSYYTWIPRITTILAVLFQSIADILCLLVILGRASNSKLVAGLFAISAILLMIGLAVFTSGVRVSIYFGYSYILGWVAFCISFLLSISSAIILKGQGESLRTRQEPEL